MTCAGERGTRREFAAAPTLYGLVIIWTLPPYIKETARLESTEDAQVVYRPFYMDIAYNMFD